MQQAISRKEAKEKGLKHYFTGKHCKYGHIAERFASTGHCCVCSTDRERKYREQNKEKVNEAKRKWCEQNREKTNKKTRKYYEKNKEKIAERNRKYREQNKDKIAEKKRKYREQNKEKVVERSRDWRKANPEQVFIRNSLNRILTNWKGGRAKAEKFLGYTCEQLRSHIESRFEDGMSWTNRSEWHIDHVKPVSAFIKEGITDPAIINALDNLQPLWSHENWSKSAKMVMEKSNEN